MNRHPRFHRKSARTARRSGVSLIEVLISMIIMSIGIMGLATLLPISILRTAQATQLTHAVFLKNNAQALLESNPNALNNAVIPTTGTSYTIGATNYLNLNDSITYAVIDPLGYNLTPPIGSNTFWLSAQPNPLLVATYPYLPRLNLGYTTSIQAGGVASLPDSWTSIVEDIVTYTPGTPPTLTMAARSQVPVLNLYNNYSTFNNLNNAHYRLVMFDITGNNVVIKPLCQASGQVLSWWDVTTAGVSLTSGTSLPVNFIPVRARIEVMERRFSWMMTAKKQVVDSTANTWTSDVDVAVFFNRSFSPNDEYAYTVYFVPPRISSLANNTYPFAGGFDGKWGVAGVDDDNDLVVDNTFTTNPAGCRELGWPGSDDNRTVSVVWTPAPVGTDPKPFLKKGGFMLEPNNLEWYRILDMVIIPPVAPATQFTAVLLLDRDVRYDPEVTVPGYTTAGAITLSGIFMRGVVDVYPLGTINGGG